MTDSTGTPRIALGPAGWVIALAGLALVGATAFGLWHIVVGGLINGNPRAAGFGVALALAAGIPLLVGAVIIRRRHRD